MKRALWFALGLMVGASTLAWGQDCNAGYMRYFVKWVKFEDSQGGQHYYWLEDKNPFEIVIPDFWPGEPIKSIERSAVK